MLDYFTKTETNNLLVNKIDKVTTTNNNIWYLYFQRNNGINLVPV